MSSMGSFSTGSTGDLFTWINVTDATKAMDINTGYIANYSGGVVTLILPITVAVGAVLAVVGSQNGWMITQNAGQTIRASIGGHTTTGISGALLSTNQYDCAELVCIVANTDFVIRNYSGRYHML
jgi:hypothetical protein